MKNNWITSDALILTRDNGEFDGTGWTVSRRHVGDDKHSAREWVMDGNLVKIFRDEKRAIAHCKNLNRP